MVVTTHYSTPIEMQITRFWTEQNRRDSRNVDGGVVRNSNADLP